MPRIGLGLAGLALAGLTGCQSLRDFGHDTHAVRPADSCAISSVVQSLPEPGLVSCVETSRVGPGRRWGRAGKSSGLAVPEEMAPLVDGDPSRFAVKPPEGTETGFEKNPTLDVPKAVPAVAVTSQSGPYRRITESDVRLLATAASRPAHRLELESVIPASYSTSSNRNGDTGSLAVDRFLREARDLATRGERIKAAGEAATTFFQLAEAEGQAELLRAGIEAFDKTRTEAGKTRVHPQTGQRYTPPAESLAMLDRQRADLLKNAQTLAFACDHFNIDLKRQAGLVGNTTDRLYPSGEFGIDATPIDAEAEVQTAIAQRPDLQMLRLAYYELNAETLPAIREQLRQTIGLMAPPRILPGIAARHPAVKSVLAHFGKSPDLDPLLVHELAVRKAQLHDLICEKEREAADQVRKAAAWQNAAFHVVGMAKWKADSLKQQLDGMKQNKEATLLEWYKARAEVISAVMSWHQARVKLAMAKGD
jgi:hypothetical protein